MEQQPPQQQRQPPKDVNPYAAAQQLQQQRIGMAMIPEQSMDLSMLSLDNDAFNFQPQVFTAVIETPEVPATIDTSILSGKTSNFVGEHFDSEDDKVEMPALDRPVEKTLAPKALSKEQPAASPAVVDEEFENDPEFALYHSAAEETTETKPLVLDADDLAVAPVDIFGGIESEKVLARYDLVDASDEEQSALLAMARVQRLATSLDRVILRLDQLTMDQ
jgi:hypothetical protein